ncbi:GNAT family N-acetyltransferase [Halobacillus salinarum]|uniref:GNAT family N-acetyltransferase n=1 Tax=Halobacillus salinarum TaxID=2932257 RepID=A0ABY4EJV4_9BACI|nr:N-acetyltransferase [Halobacillus salinarum]UOQ44755.1 GNAT family N-acetyltransferase [Halobacillus salinarum]
MPILYATEADLKQIYPHTGTAISEGSLGYYEGNSVMGSNMMQAVIRNGGKVLVVKENEQVCGWLLYGIQFDEFTGVPFGYLYDLHVFKRFRKRGYGKALMQTAIDEIKAQGIKKASLLVYKENTAIEIYKSLGFKETCIVMHKQLD